MNITTFKACQMSACAYEHRRTFDMSVCAPTILADWGHWAAKQALAPLGIIAVL